MSFMCFLEIHCKNFTFTHNPVFGHSDTLFIYFIGVYFLHINGKQFWCSVFTFVQYKIYIRRLLTWRNIEWFSQPLHIINKLGQIMSILPTVILPRWKEHKICQNSISLQKSTAKTSSWKFCQKMMQLFLPAYRKVQEKITWTGALKVDFSPFLLMWQYFDMP